MNEGGQGRWERNILVSKVTIVKEKCPCFIKDMHVHVVIARMKMNQSLAFVVFVFWIR